MLYSTMKPRTVRARLIPEDAMDPRPHTTMSGIELDAVYGPSDAERPGGFCACTERAVA